MAAGLLAISAYTPARDRQGRLVPGARMDIYANRTTTRVAVYADAALSTPLPNPVVANASGQFPAVWADGGLDSVPILYTLAYSASDGTTIGNPSVFDDIQPSVSLDLIAGQTKAERDLSDLKPVNHLLGGPLATFSPVGNGWATKGFFNLLFDDTNESVSVRQFDFALGANYSKGTPGTGGGSESGPGDEGAKCLMYGGVNMRPGCYKAWTQNLLMHLAEGVTPEYVNIVEFDIDNHSGQSFGTGIGTAGLTGAAVWGVTINGGNPAAHTVTGAQAIISSAAGPIYERGYVVAPGAVVQAAFDDYSNGTASYRDLGSHEYGVDLSGAYSAMGVRVPNGVSYGAKRNNNTNAALMALDASNNLQLGASGVTDTFVGTSLYPNADNAKALGGGSLRFSAIYLATAPIVTSDPEQKTDMRRVSDYDYGPIFDAVSGWSYQFKVGGQEQVLAPCIETVQATETVEVAEEYIEIIDGAAVRQVRMITEERPLWDELPLVDAEGAPILREVVELDVDDQGVQRMIRVRTPARDDAGNPMVDEQGEPVFVISEQPAKRKRMIPATHRVARMVKKEILKETYVDRAGARRHWGFDADEIAAIGDILGEDFAGYVVGENGEKFIRPDQLAPFLWEEVKALRRRVSALENRVV